MIIRQTESVPAIYPALDVDGIEDGVVWQRLDHYLSYRWPVREVVWIVDGVGEFIPPLAHWNITKTEDWTGKDWHETSLGLSGLGVWLEGGRYRLTADVGSDDDVPVAVHEAAVRLAEYLVEVQSNDAVPAGARSYTISEGSLSIRADRTASHAAKALQYSGAADLLRPWRRA